LKDVDFFLIKKRLQTSLVFYSIGCERNRLQIVGEKDYSWKVNATKELLTVNRKNLEEIDGLKEKIEKGRSPVLIDRMRYIQGIFPQTKVFMKKGEFNSHLYFFEDNLKAVLAPFRF